MARSLVLIACATIWPAMAQFESLSCLSDGSTVFFTSQLRQSGSGQPEQGKVFAADENGVWPLLIRERELYPPPAPIFRGSTNFYDFGGVWIAGGASRIAVSARRECGLSAGACVHLDQYEIYDAGGVRTLSGNGNIKLSPNGRWGLETAVDLAGMGRITVIDLENGRRFPVNYVTETYFRFAWREHGIANDGTSVIAARGEVYVHRLTTTQVIRNRAENIASGNIDAAGAVIVWVEEGKAVFTARLDDLRPVRLSTPEREDFAAQLSEDGRRIAVLSTPAGADDPQVHVMGFDGSGREQLSAEPEGIRSMVLSGDGEVVWAVTRTGRLMKFGVSSGSKVEVSGAVPAFLQQSVNAAVGAPVLVRATVMADASLTVDADGMPVPVLGVEQGAVTLQVPWELTPLPASYTLRITPSEPGDWVGGLMKLQAVRVFPSFVARSQVFRPGETIRLYGTGFGAVSPPVATGVATPDAPRSSLNATMFCWMRTGFGPLSPGTSETPVEVEWVGLAAGTIGQYEVRLKPPVILPRTPIVVSCDIPGWSVGYSRFETEIRVNE